MFHAHMVMWKILRWIFTLPQIQHGATLIFFSYHVYLFSIEASEFRNNLQFWKYYPIPRALKRKTGFPQSLSLSTQKYRISD